MLRFTSNVLIFFVVLFIFACDPPKKLPSIKKFKPKNSVPKHKVKQSAPESPATRSPSSESPVPANVPDIVPEVVPDIPEVVFVAEKMGSYPENMMTNNTFHVTDEVLDYINVNFKVPLSKIRINLLNNRNRFVEVTEGTESNIKYSVEESDLDDTYNMHVYDEDAPNEDNDSNINIHLDSIKNADGTVRVVGEMTIDICKKDEASKGVLAVIFGDQSSPTRDCDLGTVEASDGNCYKNPVIFNTRNEAQSGKVFITFSKGGENSKEYDIAKETDKETLKKLGVFNIK